MLPFQKYSNYYDAIYRDKDYKKEVDFLKQAITKYSPIKVEYILSLGCGTANHDILLAQDGYKIIGIDQSKEILEIAEKKVKENNLDIQFKLADIRDFELEEKSDFAMAMFNVIGYQIENEDIEKTLRNISRSLKENALFVFDCWYGPAVLKDRPVDRVKAVNKKGKDFIRKTSQKLDIEKSIININFKLFEEGKDIAVVEEDHRMRFWYLAELSYFLEKSGFQLVKACNFLDLDSKISEDNWNIFIIAQNKNQ